MHRTGLQWLAAACLVVVIGCGDCNTGVPQTGGQQIGEGIRFTTTPEFDTGNLINLSNQNGELRLSQGGEGGSFPFIWIALSARNTICKIDTETGEILGEYRTAPDGVRSDPSRTTVTLDGSCWCGNRQDSSAFHVGLVEGNQAIDRNGNGTIETSSGYGDVLPWDNSDGDDTNGGVTNASDEAVLHYVKVAASATRHITVNADNDIWVSGIFGSNDHTFQLIDSDTGTILRTEGPFTDGGYGGVIDRNGIIWSASSSGGGVLRWDPNTPIQAGVNPITIDIPNYGMTVDPFGNIWVSMLSGFQVRKLDGAGTVIGTFTKNHGNAQGLAADSNGHIWIGSSLFGGTIVTHMLNDGTELGEVTGVGDGSTGVAIDAAGKIWTANIIASNASRIDPALGPVGSDGVTPVGQVDLTVDFPATAASGLPQASPYNYSDMTGAIALQSASIQGTWQITHDSGLLDAEWGKIAWNTEGGSVPPGASIVIQARAANTIAALGSESFVDATNGQSLGLMGRFIEIRITLKANGSGDSPVLTDFSIEILGGTDVVG